MTEREYQMLKKKEKEGSLTKRERKRLKQADETGRTSEGYSQRPSR
jgi:hypothetical protein